MLLRILAITALLSEWITAAEQAGFQVSMSQKGVQYLVDTMLPVIMHEFGTVSLPNIGGHKDGFDYSLSGFSCSGLTIGAATVNTAQNTGVGISMSGIGISCHGSWSFKLKSWPHVPKGSGSVDISISSTSATLTVDAAASNYHPVLSPHSVSLNIGNFHMSFHGSLWDWLLNLFKGLIESGIKKAVQSTFAEVVTKVIVNNVNPKLAAIQMNIPLHLRAPYNVAEARFGMTANPVATSGFVGVPLQGDIVLLANPVPPPISPPALPPFNQGAANYYMQLQLSSYSFLSAAYAFYSAGLTQWLFSSGEIPLHLNTTAAYALIAPGLPTRYPNAAVSVEIAMQGMPSFDLNPRGVNISVPLLMSFLVDAGNGTRVNAFSLDTTTGLGAILTVGQDSEGSTALMGKVRYLSALLQVHNTNVGNVNAQSLQTFTDFMLSTVVVPMVNAIFGNGISFPTVGGVTLSDPLIAYGDQYVAVGTNFILNPAQFFESENDFPAHHVNGELKGVKLTSLRPHRAGRL